MVRTVVLFVCALLLVACADGEFLAGDGRASEWIGEASAPSTAPPETTTTTLPPPPITPTVGLSWFNDPLAMFAGGEETVEADHVIASLWSQGSGTDRYLQAAITDMSLALPGLEFPSMLPEDGRYISSQLVYSLQTGRLASDFVAAFGVWTVEPYTQTRDLSQRAVLFVGHDDIDRASLAADPSGGCAWFRDRDFRACEQGPADLGPSWWVETFEGRTLIWLDGLYRYELRGRGVTSAVVEAVARSMVPLVELLATGTTPSAG